MFKINGHTYKPQQFTVTLEDLDRDAGRDNGSGLMHRHRIARKRTLAIVMPPMDSTTAAQLLMDMQNESFNVTYFDPFYGVGLTRNFYVGNRTCTMYYEGGFDPDDTSHGAGYYSGKDKDENNKVKFPHRVMFQSIAFDLVEM